LRRHQLVPSLGNHETLPKLQAKDKKDGLSAKQEAVVHRHATQPSDAPTETLGKGHATANDAWFLSFSLSLSRRETNKGGTKVCRHGLFAAKLIGTVLP
jgi:hypothetical protein